MYRSSFCCFRHFLSFNISKLLTFLETSTTPHLNFLGSAKLQGAIFNFCAPSGRKVIASSVYPRVCLDVLGIVVELIPRIIFIVAR
jgi:hypothetical protein